MPRAPATFKQADAVRAYRAARAAGLEVYRTEITADGRIVLVHKGDEAPAASPEAAFDQWKARRNARPA
jgi:uncharacterized protein GlcG (DUF336 family)